MDKSEVYKQGNIKKLNILLDKRAEQIDKINKNSNGFNTIYYHNDYVIQYLSSLLVKLKMGVSREGHDD